MVTSISQMSTRVKVVVMAGVMLSMFTAAMDQTIMSTALPRVVAHLGGLDLFSWVFTAFMLTSTTTVPIVGKLSDIFGRKPFYVIGIIAFLVGSILCGLSQSMVQLIIFRAIQGIGAGVLMSTSFAIIADVFTPRERGRWSGLLSGVFALASVTGPLIGGAITDNLSWRWVFYINLPIGLVALAIIIYGLPWLKAQGVSRYIDYPGVTVMIAGLVPLLLALVWAGDRFDWASPQIIAMLVWSAAMAALLVWIEQRAPEPLLPLDLFKERIFATSIAVTFFTGMAMFGIISFMPLFIQGVIGTSATRSGLVTMPMSLGISISAAISGQLISRTGRYRYLGIAGLAIMLVGAILLSRLEADATYRQAVIAMAVSGAGLGVTMPLYMLAVQNSLPFSKLGVATSAIQFFRSIGGTMGVAVVGSLVIGRLKPEIARQMPSDVAQAVPPDLLRPFENPQILLNSEALSQVQAAFARLGAQGPALFDQALEAVRLALAISISRGFTIGIVLVAVGFIIAWLVPEVPLRRTMEMEAPPEGELTVQPPEARRPDARPGAGQTTIGTPGITPTDASPAGGTSDGGS